MNHEKRLFNPMQHPEWIPPHSQEWYDELSSEEGQYKYPWKSQFDKPTAETQFAQMISSHLTADSRLLDIGCGHGHRALFLKCSWKETISLLEI
jgi:cyclopropane fatty-acyl-phospholipid synthase-like methyltransferase